MKTKKRLLAVLIISTLLVSPGIAQDLFNEISHGHIDNVKSFIENNPGLIHTRQAGIYPLHHAVRNAKKEIAEYLISKGADINRFAKDITEFAPIEFTPLTDAIRLNNIEWNWWNI